MSNHEKIFRVSPSFLLAKCGATEARELLGSRHHQFVSKSETFLGACIEVPTLSKIFHFSNFILDTKHDGREKISVLCSGNDPLQVTECAFLLGSYLISCEDYSDSDVINLFSPISSEFIEIRSLTNNDTIDHVSILDCWKALFHAKSHGWVDFINSEIDNQKTIDPLEHLHYDNPANGNLHVLVPSQLILFECPSDIDSSETWKDVDGVRQFSASYYSDILRDFDVSLIVRCGSPRYDPSPFHTCGMEMEDLFPSADGDVTPGSHSDADSPASQTTNLYFPPPASPLWTIDRFLSLMDQVPGAVALHGDASGELGRAAETLATAFLIRRHHFAGAAALAWIRMVHPSQRCSCTAAAAADSAAGAAVEAVPACEWALDQPPAFTRLQSDYRRPPSRTPSGAAAAKDCCPPSPSSAAAAACQSCCFRDCTAASPPLSADRRRSVVGGRFSPASVPSRGVAGRRQGMRRSTSLPADAWTALPACFSTAASKPPPSPARSRGDAAAAAMMASDAAAAGGAELTAPEGLFETLSCIHMSPPSSPPTSPLSASRRSSIAGPAW